MPLRYNPKLKLLARELRKKSTLAEVLLWQQLSRKRRLGFDFHRQRPIDEFIVDFFAPELLLAIEIDGSSHKLRARDDEVRQGSLEKLGVRFLRFSEQEVRTNLDGVVLAIDRWILQHR